MIARLTTMLKDNVGDWHKMGETVEILRETHELGTERTLLQISFADGRRAVLLPRDVEIVNL